MADKNKLLDDENNPHGMINVKFLVPNKDPKDTTGKRLHFALMVQITSAAQSNFLESFYLKAVIWHFLRLKKQQKFRIFT